MNLTVQKYFKYFYSNSLLSVISEPCKITLSGMPIIDNIEEVFVRRANKVDFVTKSSPKFKHIWTICKNCIN